MSYLIDIFGEEIVLMPEASLFWTRRSTLFVADLHLGSGDKPSRGLLRRRSETIHADLQRLSRALRSTKAKKLVILGDLFHAKTKPSPAVLHTFTLWREHHSELELVLVRGNHDRAVGDPPSELNIEVVDPGCTVPPFVLYHEPPPTSPSAGYALCGHYHPAAGMPGSEGQEILLPCFWFRSRRGILPAFGSATGYRDIHAKSTHRVYVIADGRVVKLG